MLGKDASAKALGRLFRRVRVVDIRELFRVLETVSRMSVFRRLRDVGYRSSYTHNGRYYTLEGSPQFDVNGLWFHQGIGFSRAGTLKATLVQLVGASEAGKTHGELKQLLRVGVQNPLLCAVHEGHIGRQRLEKVYLYVSADAQRVATQVESRRRLLEEPTRPLAPLLVIEVLVEVIQASSEVIVEPTVVIERLASRGIEVSEGQVGLVYCEHGLVPEKNTDLERSRH
jgi:hypothetical protein